MSYVCVPQFQKGTALVIRVQHVSLVSEETSVSVVFHFYFLLSRGVSGEARVMSHEKEFKVFGYKGEQLV